MKNIFRISGVILLIAIILSCKKDKPSPPIITTIDVTEISQTTATSGGNLTDEGGSPIVSRGVCWNTLVDPTVENNKTIEIGGLGIFTSFLTQLIPNTMYYVRAYAMSSNGIGYGNQVSFTTLHVAVPILTTTAVTSITQTTAISGGNITDDGGSQVTARGVSWSITANPTIANSKTIDDTGIGTFTSSITGLTLNTTYYLRAYATNSIGTGYGNEISFTTSPVPIGGSYQGGIVAYILQPGDPGYMAGQTHGLIAAPSDQSIAAQWGCYEATISGALGTAIGTGNQNTIDIMAGCSTTGIAARLCGDLVLGGYSDWYLPSKDELNKLFLNKTAIGGLANDYWSSSQYDSKLAWDHSFTYSTQYTNSKFNGTHVRAVRSF